MRLILLHKILILAAGALGILLGAWGFHDYSTEHRASSLGLAVAGIVLAAVLVAYFFTINRRYASIADKERK